MEIEDAWAAYQFDQVVAEFGLWVENKLSQRDEKGRPKFTLEKLIADEQKPVQYASMAMMVTKKVKVENGVWDAS